MYVEPSWKRVLWHGEIYDLLFTSWIRIIWSLEIQSQLTEQKQQRLLYGLTFMKTELNERPHNDYGS